MRDVLNEGDGTPVFQPRRSDTTIQPFSSSVVLTNVVMVSVVSALILLSILGNGYSFAYGGQHEQLPLIMRVLDPGYIQNDWYVNTSSGVNARYFFSYMMAGLAFVMGLEAAYFLVHLINLVLLSVSIILLARAIWGLPGAGIIGVVVALYSLNGNLGSSLLIRPSLFPSSLAYAIIALAAFLLYRRRIVASALLFTLAGILHPLGGFEGTSLFAVAAFMSYTPAERRARWKGFGLLAIAAAIPLALGLLVKDSAGGTVDQQTMMYILAWERAPWHYVPSTWPLALWVNFGAFALLTAIARYKIPGSSFLDWLLVAIAAFCVVGCIGFVVPQLVGTIILQPFRMTVLFQLVAALYLGRYAWSLFAEPSWARRAAGVVLLSGILFGRKLPDDHIIWVALGMLAFELASWSERRFKVSAPGWLAALPVAILAAYVVVNLAPSPVVARNVNAMHVHFMYIGVVVLTVGLAAAGSRLITQGSTSPVVVGISLAVCLYMITAISLAWLDVPLSPFMTRMNRTIEPYRINRTPIDPAAEWARDNTPHDAVFIVPPTTYTFRYTAERAIVADVNAIPRSDISVLEWRKRITDLAGGKKLSLGYEMGAQLDETYNRLSTDQFRAIAQKYNASYVVVQPTQVLDLPLVHETRQYNVYQVTP